MKIHRNINWPLEAGLDTFLLPQRLLGSRMGEDLIESLIIIELPCAFLAPWLLFCGLIIFFQQIVESTQQISVLPS